MSSTGEDENAFFAGNQVNCRRFKTISAWCLSIIVGSVLILLSSSYLHPVEKKIRLIFSLFVVGWSLIAISIYYGINISGELWQPNCTQKGR